MAGKRWQRQMRTRVERAREEAIAQLRDLGISPDTNDGGSRDGGDHPRDEGDHAQASERADLDFMTRERIAERINALSQALERLDGGTYGRCETCGADIEPARLDAMPDAARCLACQEKAERERAA
jgi:DnaK suppressor protein